MLLGLDRVSPGYEGCILVEGLFSVFHLYTFRGVQGVALMGCSISDEQIELLACRTKRITVLMDGDAAGRAARKEIVARLAERLHVYAPLIPDGNLEMSPRPFAGTAERRQRRAPPASRAGQKERVKGKVPKRDG